MTDTLTRLDVDQTLALAEQVIRWVPDPELPPLGRDSAPEGPLHVGVDLGTAYLVLVVLDEAYRPLAGEYQFAQVVRDGLVVDFIGAVDRLREMKARVETRLGRELTHAASGFPPGVPQPEVRAVANVLEAADLRCTVAFVPGIAADYVVLDFDGAAETNTNTRAKTSYIWIENFGFVLHYGVVYYLYIRTIYVNATSTLVCNGTILNHESINSNDIGGYFHRTPRIASVDIRWICYPIAIVAAVSGIPAIKSYIAD